MSVQVNLNNNTAPFILRGEANYDLFTMARIIGRVGNLLQYTLLGKRVLAIGAVTPNVGNTGNGTVTGFALAPQPGGALVGVGNYTLICTAVVANGGTFDLKDPNNVVIAKNLVITAGAGAATVFVTNGFTFTITDGTTDFIVGDNFTLAVTAVNKFVPFNPTALDGAGKVAGIYLGEDILASEIDAADITTCPVLYSEADIDESQMKFENGAALTTLCQSGLTVDEELSRLEIMTKTRLNIGGTF